MPIYEYQCQEPVTTLTNCGNIQEIYKQDVFKECDNEDQIYCPICKKITKHKRLFGSQFAFRLHRIRD